MTNKTITTADREREREIEASYFHGVRDGGACGFALALIACLALFMAKLALEHFHV